MAKQTHSKYDSEDNQCACDYRFILVSGAEGTNFSIVFADPSILENLDFSISGKGKLKPNDELYLNDSEYGA